MNCWLLALLFPLLLATGPAPLVVGVVRDQYGAAISGARVAANSQSTQTDASGTFALSEANVRQLRVSCDYCRPATANVTPGEPVVVLVHRYDAVAADAPTQRDIAYVPYARAESVAGLRAFTVLENSSAPLPGAQLSDRGSTSRGMLVQSGGIPLYDVATNQSPFVSFPSYDVAQISTRPPGDAFLYGDLAGGGTLLLDTQTLDAWDGALLGGSSSALRAAQTLSETSWSTAASHDDEDTRARADGGAHFASGDDTFDLRAFAAQDRDAPDTVHLDTSVGGARLSFENVRANRIDASLTADGGGYGGAAQNLSYDAKWSDVEAQGSVTTNTPVQFFTGAALQDSSGYYSTSNPSLKLAAGTIAQTRIDAGAQTAGQRYALRAGIGAFTMQYTGGLSGAHAAFDGSMIAPGFTGSYALDPHWTYELQAGESFRLPTILEAFAAPPDGASLVFDRNAQLVQTLTYGDLRRFRAGVTALTQRVSGLDNGMIHSSGVSLAWQVAPALSLRAWLLHENDQTQVYEPVYRFGTRPRPATVGSYWLTYETSGLRIDAIYRRDLLNYTADPHFDASVSTPVSTRLRLFAATERLAGSRLVTIGVRAQPF